MGGLYVRSGFGVAKLKQKMEMKSGCYRHTLFPEKLIILPFHGVVDDVFRNVYIGLLVADDVVVITALPYFGIKWRPS